MSRLRALVTGVSGQVGGALLRRAAPGVEMVPAGREVLDLARPHALAPVLERLAPDVVVNCAAYTAVDKAEAEAELAHTVNAAAPAEIAAWCGARGRAMIQVSTDYVFDGARAGAWRPEDAVHPINAYGASKEAGERAVRASCPRHVILRTAWVYSAGGNNFVRTMLRLGRERDELRVVDDQHGCPTAADEVARALAAVLASLAAGREGPWGTYHFCGAGATTWRGLAEAAFDLAAPHWGRRPVVTPIATAEWPTPAPRPANSVLDCSAFARDYAVAPLPWREALAPVVAAILHGEKGEG